MIIKLEYRERSYWCDLSKPADLSIPIGQVRCFFAEDFNAQPFRYDSFVGSVQEGAPVNFYNFKMNPHGNGTHTECLGHITRDHESINKIHDQHHFIAQLVSVPLNTNEDGDQLITLENLKSSCPEIDVECLIIRTLPNKLEKLNKDYSGTNPPYLQKEAMEFIVQQKVTHLLIDLPSVDKEVDEGVLMTHRIFWNVEGNQASSESRIHSTITELIYIPDDIPDGLYFLNLQVPPIELDAVPSRPTIYQLYEEQ